MTSGISAAFVGALKDRGFDFFTTVPCSLLKGALSILEQEPRDRYVPAVREDAAFGFAVGAWMGGRKPVVLIQNSGLGVSLNALASLLQMNAVPCLIVVSWRGHEGKDAPEHIKTGAIMLEQLDLMEIPYEVLEPDRMQEQLATLDARMEATRLPVALVVRKGMLDR